METEVVAALERSIATYDRKPPPPLQHALVAGTTFAVYCQACQREIAADVITLVEGVEDIGDFDSAGPQCPRRSRGNLGNPASMLAFFNCKHMLAKCIASIEAPWQMNSK